MDLGKAIVAAWKIYLNNFLVIFAAGILATLLSWLLTPLVGLQMMFVKAKRGEAVSFNELFAPFNSFLNIYLASLWLSFILLLLLLPGLVCLFNSWNGPGAFLLLIGLLVDLYLLVIWTFTFLLIYDKKLEIGEAMSASRELVTRNNYLAHLLLWVIFFGLSILGNSFLTVGIFFTLPLALGIMACAYADETR